MSTQSSEARQTESFQAPHHKNASGPSGHYLVQFKPTYASNAGLAALKHLRLLKLSKQDFELQTYQLSSDVFGYHAELSSELLDFVRHDSGVMHVEDDIGQTTRDISGEQSYVTASIPDLSSTSTYEAPYQRSATEHTGSYLVFFHPYRTPKDHFAFIGQEFPHIEWSVMRGYAARLDDNLLAAVRRDPGVRLVKDDKTDHAADKRYPPYSHYIDSPSSYIVNFLPGYTLEEHLDFLGFDFKRSASWRMGYGAQLNDDQFVAILGDPQIDLVEDDAKVYIVK